MKKLLAYLLTAVMLSSCVTVSGQGVDNAITKPEILQLEIGDYFTLGKYNDEPILWRYVADDEKGKLIVSDKILCFKTFSDGVSEIHNLWEESFPRKWLNSMVSEGEVTWGDFDDHLWTKDNIDADEKGFLHESNFTSSERSVLKTVTQKTMVPSDRLDLATNGTDKAYSAIKEYKPGGPKDGGYLYFYDISELSNVYSGASHELTDTMFLMDEMQVYQMWKNLGCVKALCTEKCIRPENYSDSEYKGYFLRTPSHVESLGSYYTTESVSYISMSGYYDSMSSYSPAGIRPAYYLDEANAVMLSGSGTEDAPYVVDGKYSNTDNTGVKQEVPTVDNLEIGDYIQLGKYYDQPIVWRCIDIDDNGILMLSEKALCQKTFGTTNFWADSALRKWLNSDVGENESTWDFGSELFLVESGLSPRDAIWEERPMSYFREKGFLNKGNFSDKEKTVMKKVTQWTMLPQTHLGLAENGETDVYNPIKEWSENMGITQPTAPQYLDISELQSNYRGAAHKVEDTVFLLDEMQMSRMWNNFGNTYESVAAQLVSTMQSDSNEWIDYYLRSPCGRGCLRVTSSGRYGGSYVSNNYGIRPAFYLDVANAVILSGSGTEDDPYVVDGKLEERIRVFYDGIEIEFDVPPVIENDRTLVPFRAIFEAMGASVEWEEATELVTGMLNETTIRLTIGSGTAFVNDNSITLDVAPKLMNDRTLVPLRFVAENFGFKVDWNEAEQRIDINSIK